MKIKLSASRLLLSALTITLLILTLSFCNSSISAVKPGPSQKMTKISVKKPIEIVDYINAKDPVTIKFPAVKTKFLQLRINASNTSGKMGCVDELEIYFDSKSSKIDSDSDNENITSPNDCPNTSPNANGINLARLPRTIVTTSSVIQNYPIHQTSHLTDGLYGNDHSWIPGASDQNPWLQIEWQESQSFDRIVYSRDRSGKFADRLINDLEILTSNDGKSWSPLLHFYGVILERIQTDMTFPSESLQKIPAGHPLDLLPSALQETGFHDNQPESKPNPVITNSGKDSPKDVLKDSYNNELKKAILGEENAWLKTLGLAAIERHLIQRHYPEYVEPPLLRDENLPLPVLTKEEFHYFIKRSSHSPNASASNISLSGISLPNISPSNTVPSSISLSNAIASQGISPAKNSAEEIASAKSLKIDPLQAEQLSSLGTIRVTKMDHWNAGPLVQQQVAALIIDDELFLTLSGNRFLSDHLATVSVIGRPSRGIITLNNSELRWKAVDPFPGTPAGSELPLDGTFDRSTLTFRVRIPLSRFPGWQSTGLYVALGIEGDNVLPGGHPVCFIPDRFSLRPKLTPDNHFAVQLQAFDQRKIVLPLKESQRKIFAMNHLPAELERTSPLELRITLNKGETRTLEIPLASESLQYNSPGENLETFLHVIPDTSKSFNEQNSQNNQSNQNNRTSKDSKISKDSKDSQSNKDNKNNKINQNSQISQTNKSNKNNQISQSNQNNKNSQNKPNINDPDSANDPNVNDPNAEDQNANNLKSEEKQSENLKSGDSLARQSWFSPKKPAPRQISYHFSFFRYSPFEKVARQLWDLLLFEIAEDPATLENAVYLRNQSIPGTINPRYSDPAKIFSRLKSEFPGLFNPVSLSELLLTEKRTSDSPNESKMSKSKSTTQTFSAQLPAPLLPFLSENIKIIPESDWSPLVKTTMTELRDLLGQYADLIQKTPADSLERHRQERDLFWKIRLLKRNFFLSKEELAPLEKILVNKRHPFHPSHNYSDLFDSAWHSGGAVAILSLPRHPDGRLEPEKIVVEDLVSAGEGVLRNPAMSYDLQKIYYANRQSKTDYFKIMEFDRVTKKSRQISPEGPFHDFWPTPLPDGALAFISTRCAKKFICWRPQAFVLYRMELDGSKIRELSHANLSEFAPSVMEDGRLIWTRSEYVDKGADYGHTLWTIRIDGTMPELVYGNTINLPQGYANGRFVPETNEVCATMISHFGDLNGPICLIDSKLGPHDPAALRSITPEIPWPGYWAARQTFREPFPLSKNIFLVAHAPQNRFGIFLIDRFGNRELLYIDPQIDTICPQPMIERIDPNAPFKSNVATESNVATGQVNRNKNNLNQGNLNQGNLNQGNLNQGNRNQSNRNQSNHPSQKSPAIPSSATSNRDEKTVLPIPPILLGTIDAKLAQQNLGRFSIANVYRGLEGQVTPGTAKYLRIVQELPTWLRKMKDGTFQADHDPFEEWYASPTDILRGPFGWPTYEAKGVVGTVTIEKDGSCDFTVPAEAVLYFELLDENHNEIQRMRSVVQLQKGEQRSCIGCHESRLDTPKATLIQALRKPAQSPLPPPWGAGPFWFEKTVQPVLDKNCVECHQPENTAKNPKLIDLTGRLDKNYIPESYRSLIRSGSVHYFDYAWWAPTSKKAPPYSFGTAKSSIFTILKDQNHQTVQLNSEEDYALKTWISLNVPLWGDYCFRRERGEHRPQDRRWDYSKKISITNGQNSEKE